MAPAIAALCSKAHVAIYTGKKEKKSKANKMFQGRVDLEWMDAKKKSFRGDFSVS